MELVAAFIRNLPAPVWYLAGYLTPFLAVLFLAVLIVRFEGTSGGPE